MRIVTSHNCVNQEDVECIARSQLSLRTMPTRPTAVNFCGTVPCWPEPCRPSALLGNGRRSSPRCQRPDRHRLHWHGRPGRCAHIDIGLSLKKEGLCDTVAVCDVYGPRVRAAAEKTGGKIYRRYQDLLADPRVDVVCIATPDRHHAQQAIDAVRAGKDVYCEKPLTHWSQFDLAKQLGDEAAKHHRIVQVGTQFVADDAYAQIRQLIAEGIVGKILHVQAAFFRRGDWGERMDIPDPNAQPGPDLDWEQFLGDGRKLPKPCIESQILARGWCLASSREKVLQIRHYQFGGIIAGITAGKEYGVEPGQSRNRASCSSRAPCPFRRVLEIEVGRGPNPIVHFVAGADFAELAVHHRTRYRHVRTFAVVLERDALNAVRAEQGQFADVLFELLFVPAVVAVGRVPIAELMAANGQGGRGGEVEMGWNAGVTLSPT